MDQSLQGTEEYVHLTHLPGVVFIVLHTTPEGFGLHIPSSRHSELLLDGENPDSSHW